MRYPAAVSSGFKLSALLLHFFARARWELDQLSLAVARLVLLVAVPPGGNCFVTAAIVVRLPFCSREIGLPVPTRRCAPCRRT